MRDIFTTKEFQLDISELDITIDDKNPRFKDNLSTKFTFPFEFNIDAVLTGKMSDYSSINALDIKKRYEGLLTIEGRVKKATLIILSSVGKVIKAQFDLGFEEFPNAQKKLRELPLEIVKSTTAMHNEANTVIEKNYPETNYNFPMIFTDSYKETKGFEAFEGIYNYRKNGAFVSNIGRENLNEYENKNLVVPMPYLLYVIKAGIEDAGFTLHGDILEDELLKSIILAPSKKIDVFQKPDTVQWIFGGTKNGGLFDGKPINDTQSIIHYGKFRIKGFVIILNPKRRDRHKRARIYFNKKLVWESAGALGRFPFDFTIESLKNQENKLELRIDKTIELLEHLKADIIPVEMYDENGEKISSLANFSEYKLSENLPDITFIELLNTVKNLQNYDWEIKNENEVHMNFIDKAFQNKNLKDLSQYEVNDPERIIDKDISFHLKYKDVDLEKVDYKFSQVYFDLSGIKTENITLKNNTNVIEINAIPLPIKYEKEVRTAYQFFDNESVLQLVIYRGLIGSHNSTQDQDELELKKLFYKYHKNWFDFRVKSTGIKWTFFANKNRWRNISMLDNLYIYNQKCWIENITKRSVNPKTYEITLTAEIVRN